MKNLSLTACCLLLSIVTFAGCASSKNTQVDPADRAAVKLMVLYPQPTDVAKFDSDYSEHLKLLHEKANIPDDAPLPYTITKFLPSPDGPAAYYQLFTLYFPSAEALQAARSGLGEVAADAVRISSGGAPVVLVGGDVP